MRKETRWDVVVIGGGPAGMMAAGRAGERGKRVLLLEKNPSLGKKLLITGGGRCNVTNNTPDVRVLLPRYKKSEKFLFSCFTQFGVPETLRFFHDRGMDMKEEAEGRMFPSSNTAQSVWNVLVEYMKKGGVEVRTGTSVSGISIDKQTQDILVKIADGTALRARACVVAAGGASRPETGSDGKGFAWLKKLGHTIQSPDMALVPIALKDAWVKSVAGVTLRDIKLTLYQNGAKKSVHKGKLLFTHVGVSGPTVLNMSREAGELLSGGEGSEYERKGKSNEVVIAVDLFPSADDRAMREKIHALLTQWSNKKIKNTLSALVPSALTNPLLTLAGIDGDTYSHSVRSGERKALASVLKAVPLHVKGLLGTDKAVVSSGGVALHEVDFKTMQSRVAPGVYLVGDVLNIDRPSGGYSLQLCWTTGFVAGNSCR